MMKMTDTMVEMQASASPIYLMLLQMFIMPVVILWLVFMKDVPMELLWYGLPMILLVDLVSISFFVLGKIDFIRIDQSGITTKTRLQLVRGDAGTFYPLGGAAKYWIESKRLGRERLEIMHYQAPDGKKRVIRLPEAGFKSEERKAFIQWIEAKGLYTYA